MKLPCILDPVHSVLSKYKAKPPSYILQLTKKPLVCSSLCLLRLLALASGYLTSLGHMLHLNAGMFQMYQTMILLQNWIGTKVLAL